MTDSTTTTRQEQQQQQQIPTPPSTPSPQLQPQSSSPAPSHLDTLTGQLDSLLATYLHLLDTHQRLRASLSKQFSAGFFNLAAANRTTTTGRRYGEEGFDYGGMKATKTLRIEETGEEEEKGDGDVSEYCSFKVGTAEVSQEERADEENEKEREESAEDDPQQKEKKPRQFDPLRQFGILVPPALRSAQTDFATAVEGPIPELATAVGQMRWLEGAVTELRCQISRLEEQEKERERRKTDDGEPVSLRS